jgi:hypothetical protein
MRYALLLFAAVAHGATITTTAPGFTVGPVAFSNVTYTNTASEGLRFMGFGFVPDEYPAQFFPSNTVVLHIPGSYLLDPVGVGEAVSETLSADFSIAGYNLVGMSGLGVAFTDGFGTSGALSLMLRAAHSWGAAAATEWLLVAALCRRRNQEQYR